MTNNTHCYRCGCKLNGISWIIKIKGKKAHNEVHCLMCGDKVKGKRDERGYKK